MEIYSLNGKWRMKDTGKGCWIKARVPGSVFSDLLREGLMEDPFYRDNEDKAIELSYHDYEYMREFNIPPDMFKKDKIFLYCEGLDTLTEIRINSKKVARTDNMHRCYEFDVKKFLKKGRNNIHIMFYSPAEFIKKMQKKNPLWKRTFDIAMPGYYHLRKAHSMFGWDWGPRIPDSGIWRDIGLKSYDYGRLKDTYVTQKHRKDKVIINVQVNFETWVKKGLSLEVLISCPGGGEIIKTYEIDCLENNCNFNFKIKDPELWWPNGYGKQPLYGVKVNLMNEKKIIDSKEFRIGLRALDIRKRKDKWGESFEFVVNGVSVFARGANYIIEDNLMSRYSKKRTEKLLKDCVEANFNCIRVWGGGIYPADYFFELCDRYGLIVWQDFMFACSVYPAGRGITKNIKKELEDNIKRIRNHPCLGLWCGNNEIEWMIYMLEKKPPVELHVPEVIMSTKLKQIKKKYRDLFEKIIPETVKKYDPERFYWPSSPSSGGKFNNPNDESKGDVHYWDVWHGMKPFNDYRNYYFRFTSEYGFQAFPGIKTIRSFTIPEDRNIFSYVMEKHQKNGSANGKILAYLSETFKYPKDFESLIYVSQILQAEAIKYGVEHWRRNRGRCMGSVYWQLNDCWPVASWSSIDYYGRWKALHYYAKRFYAPVLISAEDNGTRVNIYITNDTRESIKGVIGWRLRDNKSGIIDSGRSNIVAAPLKAKKFMQLNFKDMVNENNIREAYLEFFLKINEKCAGYGTVLFIKPKHFNFINPEIEEAVSEDDREFIINLESKAFAKSVEIDLEDADCRFSDNYFDLPGGYKKTVTAEKLYLQPEIDLKEIKRQLKIRSLYDIEER
jgi:beta-mannosidase